MNKIKKLMGHICVDSGMVYIGDPCYLRSQTDPDEISEAIVKAWENNTNYASLNFFKSEQSGVGIVSSTYEGDGIYPVYGLFDNHDGRPRQIIIDFCNEPGFINE